MIVNYSDIAKKYIAEKHPDAQCAFIAGSVVKNLAKENSDIDLVIIYDDNFQDVRREACIYEDTPIESFVQNRQSLAYFANCDKERGTPVIIDMVYSGLAIGNNMELAQTLKKEMNDFLKQGPEKLDKETIDRHRYVISDLYDDIKDDRPTAEMLACISALYTTLGDFYLRASDEWSGSAKGLVRRLKEVNPAYAEHYTQSFQKAFQGDRTALHALILETLEPYGGYFWAGDCQYASDAWKSFER